MATREGNLKHRYGIDQKQYDEILESQNHQCKICGTKHSGYKPLHVDHCHNSTRVRGLLCKKCNTSLGLLKEDPKIMVNAILYLDEYHKKETRAFSEAISQLAQLPNNDGAGKSISSLPRPHVNRSKNSDRSNDRVWHQLILGEDNEPIERISSTGISDSTG